MDFRRSFDGDGWLDVAFLNLQNTPTLYRNNANGGFDRVTEGALVEDVDPSGDVPGGAWADFTGDGRPSLVMARAAPSGRTNKAYIHNGGIIASSNVYNRVDAGTPGFRQLLSSSGVGSRSSHGANVAAWGDYDNDGFVDLYLAVGKLFRNNGMAGGFTEVNDLALAEDNRAQNNYGFCVGGAAWGMRARTACTTNNNLVCLEDLTPYACPSHSRLQQRRLARFAYVPRRCECACMF